MIVVVDSITGDQHIARCLGVEPGQEHHENANDIVVGIVAEGLYVLRVLELDPVHVRECYAPEHGDVRVLAHVDPRVVVARRAASLDHSVPRMHRKQAVLAVVLCRELRQREAADSREQHAILLEATHGDVSKPRTVTFTSANPSLPGATVIPLSSPPGFSTTTPLPRSPRPTSLSRGTMTCTASAYLPGSIAITSPGRAALTATWIDSPGCTTVVEGPTRSDDSAGGSASRPEASHAATSSNTIRRP